MNIEKLKEAKAEAERFLKRVDTILSVCDPEKKYVSYHNPKECGAVKRSSMDLTRALAELRKPY